MYEFFINYYKNYSFIAGLRTYNDDGYKQAAYCVYSFKLLAAEKRPDGSKTKGFDDRTFYVQCMAGKNPQYNIKDVIKAAGEEEYRQLYDELVHIRKLLPSSPQRSHFWPRHFLPSAAAYTQPYI
jgi:hypothetical protein